MNKRNYIHLGVILVLVTLIGAFKSISFASDLRIAVSDAYNRNYIQNKPTVRGGSSSSAINLKGSTNITKSNPKITLSLKNSDVQPVLRMFADKAGLNIVFHESAKGTVTLDLVNVPLNDAFRMVLQITKLTYYLDGKTLIISSLDEASHSAWSKQDLVSVPVNYVDAGEIANFLNTNIFGKNTPGLSNWDVVSINSLTNELLVFGTQSDLEMVKKVVAKFDVPPINTTFTVKHTTPAEMARLVCDMLEYTVGKSSGGSSGNNSNSNSSGSRTGSAANISGTATGFATSGGNSGSSSGSSSSGGSSSGSSSSGSSSSGSITIGKNTIACSVSITKSSGSGGNSGSNSSSSGSSSGNSGSSSSSNSSSSSGGSGLKPFGNMNIVVSYFPQRGTIQVLGGSKAQVRQIESFIKRNDVKQPQAMMEITILELSETGRKDLENSWVLATKHFGIVADEQGGIVPSIIHFGPNRETLVQTPYAEWAIKYLTTNQKGRVVANPKILITNGETSTIDLSEDYIKTVDAEIITSTLGGTAGVQRKYNVANDKGLKFELTPFISPEGYITLNLSSDYATLAGTQEALLVTEDGNSEKELVATLLNHRNIDLKNVRIKDNETLIIGGLVKEDESKSINKIPVLGDLPLIGFAFRTSYTNKSKNELLIMLTPKILNDNDDVGYEDNDSL